MISRPSLKGYLLEEILAYLLRNTGYRLLVSPNQDPTDLDKRGNGLVVKGRGAVHQVDVLGELHWIPAFTFPLRLFVEAKCYEGKTGLPEVRNAVGVLDDINQNYSPVREQSNIRLQRYSYRYALFSTSGFTPTACAMALAHQISLVDLSGAAFTELRASLDMLATAFFNELGDKLNPRQLRQHIRRTLGTWPQGLAYPDNGESLPLEWNMWRVFDEILDSVVRQFDEFLVGMAHGPFMLLLKADDPQAFIRYCEEHPSHEIFIEWRDRESDWVVRPLQSQAYRLTFALPQELVDWVFNTNEGMRERAIHVKEHFFSSITVYRHDGGQDAVYRLTYSPERLEEQKRKVWLNK